MRWSNNDFCQDCPGSRAWPVTSSTYTSDEQTQSLPKRCQICPIEGILYHSPVEVQPTAHPGDAVLAHLVQDEEPAARRHTGTRRGTLAMVGPTCKLEGRSGCPRWTIPCPQRHPDRGPCDKKIEVQYTSRHVTPRSRHAPRSAVVYDQASSPQRPLGPDALRSDRGTILR